MTEPNLRTWLLVALAVVALAVAAPAVAAHGNDSATTDAPPDDGTADDWASWMDDHMTDHIGPGSVEWMESRMGVTVDEMARDMADGAHDHYGGDAHVVDDAHRRGNPSDDDRRTPGAGHGC